MSAPCTSLREGGVLVCVTVGVSVVSVWLGSWRQCCRFRRGRGLVGGVDDSSASVHGCSAAVYGCVAAIFGGSAAVYSGSGTWSEEWMTASPSFSPPTAMSPRCRIAPSTCER
eukprot:2676495-Rhodomonas_salina.1